MLQTLIEEFGLPSPQVSIEKHGSGLINDTWIVESGNEKFILQRVNHDVFKDPYAIAFNIDQVALYLRQHHPDYLLPTPVLTKNGSALIFREGEGYFRMIPFINGSHTVDVAGSPAQAFEAAVQFGKFTRLLRGFDAGKLKTTIPDFHNLQLRHREFLQAIKTGHDARLKKAEPIIEELLHHDSIVKRFETIIVNKNFFQRVTHHDTKISNVLFDEYNNGLCVIDLDTVMPGYFISDLGDMMRTYLSPVSEEEKDHNKIEIRDEFYEAVVTGYYKEMKDVLTGPEKEHFFYAGTFMIYMQSIRFLTDYLNNDVYYGEKYPEHNLVRATNQLVLLNRMLEKKRSLTDLLKI